MTSDQFLLDHAAAVNQALHLLAKTVGVKLDGLPEPSTSYVAAATMADVIRLRDNLQDVIFELGTRLNEAVVSLASVASRPPINVTVPVPSVSVTVPDRPAVIQFARDKDGRIVAAESTPVP